MSVLRRVPFVLALGVAVVLLAACGGQQGTAEQAGEKVDKAVEETTGYDTGGAAEQAGEKLDETLEEGKQAVEEAVEEGKEALEEGAQKVEEAADTLKKNE